MRDVGALFLALIIVTVWAAWRAQATRPVAVAWLFQGVFHVVFHAQHLDGYKTADKVGLIASLVAVPLLALIAALGDHVSPSNAAKFLTEGNISD